jgi:hypothetical protein
VMDATITLELVVIEIDLPQILTIANRIGNFSCQTKGFVRNVGLCEKWIMHSPVN